MFPDVHVIITAAGTGSRFAKGKPAALPKQFQLLLGKPVILHSLLKFQKEKRVKSITISSSKDFFDKLHNIASKNGISKLRSLVEGGNTRFESVRNAYNEISCAQEDLIMIHDAARPNIQKADISRLIDVGEKKGEVILGTKISETVKRCREGVITETVNRDDLWLIHTPQVFRYDILSKSYILAGSRTDFTDESSLVENAGFEVNIIQGEPGNIKITSPADIAVLKKLMDK
jgi:2-C-methyl-D-erythritol 4-phosphate cytidylyltransferase